MGVALVQNENVKDLCASTQVKLKEAIEQLEMFLNNHSIPQLSPANDEELNQFYRGYLADFRHLLVFSEVSWEKLGVSLRRPNFNQDYAERVLYETYHSCVNLFFYPKNESYSEDGRYAYTGQDAIRFRKPPVRVVRDITVALSKMFEQLREELAYYETDYLSQRNLQTQKQ
jgi:hypothetical protein